MNARKQANQLALFECDLPEWQALSHQVQQSVLDALSQMLINALEQQCLESLTTHNSEDEHVSQNQT
jgi:hypothetical protein